MTPPQPVKYPVLLAFGLFCLGIAILASLVVLAAWFVWSVVDLGRGNPTTGCNVLGVAIPLLIFIIAISKKVKP